MAAVQQAYRFALEPTPRQERGVDLVVLKQGIGTTTPQGRLVFTFSARSVSSTAG